MATKRWADLSAGQQVGVVILGAAQLGLLIAALWDLVRRPAEQVRGDKRMWAALVFINWIGPIAYFTIGRKRGAEPELDAYVTTGADDGQGT